jgi:hypothetical protein
MQHLERERVLTNVEERLRLDAKLVSPRVFEVSKPLSQPIMSVVDGAAGCRHRRVKLDLRIRQRDKSLYVARVERLYFAAMEFDVLLRHRFSLIRVVEGVGAVKASLPLRAKRSSAPFGFTDPDARRMKFGRNFLPAYNAQAVTTEDQIVVAAEVTTEEVLSHSWTL